LNHLLAAEYVEREHWHSALRLPPGRQEQRGSGQRRFEAGRIDDHRFLEAEHRARRIGTCGNLGQRKKARDSGEAEQPDGEAILRKRGADHRNSRCAYA
jgi:hypothetical protein